MSLKTAQKVFFQLLFLFTAMFVSFTVSGQAETEPNDAIGASGVLRIYQDGTIIGGVNGSSDVVDYWEISRPSNASGMISMTIENTRISGTLEVAATLEQRDASYSGAILSSTVIHDGVATPGTVLNFSLDYTSDVYYTLKLAYANPIFTGDYSYRILGFSPGFCSGTILNSATFSATDNTITLETANATGLTGNYFVSANTSNSFTTYTDDFGTAPTASTTYGGGEQIFYVGQSGAPGVALTSLTPNTLYHFQVDAYNECTGFLNYTTPLSYTYTTCGAAPSAITAVDVSAVSTTELKINSFTGGAANHPDATLGYVVKINTANSFTAPTNGSLPTANTVYAGGEQVVYAGTAASPNVTITGLTATTQYYFQVYTYSLCSTVPYFETTGFSTDLYTCGPPPNGYNSGIGTTGGSVGVNNLAPVVFRSNTLTPSGFLVYVNDVNSFTDPDATYMTLPTQNTVYENAGQQLIFVGGASSALASISNLDPNTPYYFRSYVYYTCNGTSYVNVADYKEITLTTCNFSDNTATNPVFGTVTGSSMELNSFTPLSPDEPATAPDGYVIRMNTTNSFTSFANGTAVPTGDPAYAGSGEQVIYAGNSATPNITVTGLSTNTTYYFNIVAHYPSCHLNGVLWQQQGYSFSKSNDVSLVDPTITFNDISKGLSDPDFTLAASSNSTGAINYQIIDQTGINTSLSGANNATVTLGSAGTVTIEATQEPSGGFAGGTATATLTITAPDAMISGDPFLLINSSLDLNTQITSNSPGAFTYSILGPDLGASISGSTINSAGSTGNIVIKATQAATSQYAETDYFVLALIWDGVVFKLDRAFNIFDATVQAGESLAIIQANDFDNTDVTYTIIAPDATGSTFNNITDVFSAGSPGSVTLRASSPDNSFYNASTKDVTITIEGQPQSITFNPLANVTLGDPTFNLTATASSGLGVTFTSANTSVATVSGNTVTIVGEGTTNITASQAGGGVYDPASDVIQSLTVDPIGLIDQTVSASETSAICEVTTTVSVGSTQQNVNYYLRDNSDNSVIQGPVVGTGAGISFTAETLTASKTYEVYAELGSSSLVMTDKPVVTITPIQEQTVVLTQSNATSADVSLSSSQLGVDYYLRNNSDNTVLQGPLAGNGSVLAFTTETISAPTTYNVLAAASVPGDGVRNSLSFDGADDYATIPVLSGGTIFQSTVETWVYIPSSDDTDVNASIITHEQFDSGFGVGIPLYINISGGLIFAGNSDPEEGVTNTTGVAYPKDEWFHVAASFDGNSLLFYLNGIQVGSGFSFGFGTSFGGNWRLGRNHEATSDATKLIGGAVANTRIWSVIRSASDIANNMNTTFTTPQTNLVLNYTYSETSGNSIADLSGGNHTGTLVNALGNNTNWIEELILNGPCSLQMTDTPTAFDKPQITASDVTFNAPASLIFDGTEKAYTVSVATLTPPIPVGDLELTYEGRNGTTYASSATAPTNAGDYTVTAFVKASNTDYAGSVSEDFSITAFATTISLNLPGTNPEYSGSPQGISPTANDISSNPTLAILTEYKIQGSADPFSNTAPTNAGIYDVRANLASSEINYSAAEVTGTYTIDQGSQTITFNAIPEVACGQTTIDLSLYATSSTGATLTFVSDDLGVATISGNIATIVGAGFATITASQAGDVNNAPAIDQQQILTIAATQENFSVDNPADVLVCDGSPYVLPALTSGNYFSALGGMGTAYSAGDPITSTATLYVYGTGVNPSCIDENSFTITIENLPVDQLADVTTIGTYTLPGLTNGNYFTATGGTGTPLSAGDPISSTQTIYIFNEDAGTGCTRESSFVVTINPAPALHFDQAGSLSNYDYLSVPDANSLDVNEFTFEAWLNFDQLNTVAAGLDWRAIFSKSRYSDSYGLMVYAPSKLMRFYHAGVGAGFTDYTWSGLTAETWHHLAVKWDGTAQKTSILIDGTEVSSNTSVTGTMATNTEPLLIGASRDVAGDPYPFDGAMDEIRLWNVARTDAEILANKDIELQGTESGLVLYYNFSEGTINGDNTGLTQVPDRSTSGNNATFNSFALTGSVSNYVDGSGNGVVEGLPQSITFNALSNVTFGDADFNLGATASSGLGVTYASSDPAVATISGNTVTVVGIGTTTITASQAGDGTYLPATNVTQNLTVDPFASTINLNLPVTNPTYSGIGQGISPTANDAGGSPTLSLMIEYSPEGTGTFSTTLPVDAGAYDVRVNLAASETNFTATQATGTFTIDKAPLTARLDDASIVYGEIGANNHPATYTGFVNGETESVLNVTLGSPTAIFLNLGTGGNYNVGGPYVGAITWESNPELRITSNNYAITFESGDITSVTARPVNVTANPKSITYGEDANTGHSVIFEPYDEPGKRGLANGETAADFAGTVLFDIITEVNVGVYASTIIPNGGLTNANYAINFEAGELTITEKNLTITADNRSITYGDDADAGNTVTYSGFITGEDESVLGGDLSFTNITDVNIGTYSGVIIPEGLTSSNYNISFVEGDLTIGTRSIFVRAQSEVKIYGDVDPSITPIIASGSLVGSDAFTGAMTRDVGEDVGAYTIQQGTLTLGANYHITFLTTGSLSITRRDITVTVDAKSKTYGDADPAFTYRVTAGDLQGSDVLIGSLTRVAGENVGTYTIEQGTIDNSNYAITFDSNDLSINARPINVTADAQSKVYGNADPTLTYQVTTGALQGSDVLTGDMSRAVGENVGNYAIEQGTLDNSNYAITFVSDDLTINPLGISVTSEIKSKLYGDPDPELTFGIFSGTLINGDVLSGSLERVAGEDVGTYSINQGTLGNPNYTISFLSENLTVTARPITVTADPSTKVYGDADPSLTYQVTNGSLAVGDTFTGSLTRESGETIDETRSGLPGGLPLNINQGDLSVTNAGNYDLTFESGTFSITRRPITYSIEDATVVYGESFPGAVFNISAGSVAPGETLTLTESSVFVPIVQLRGVGTHVFTENNVNDATGVEILDGSGVDRIFNYDVTTSNNFNLSVTARPITVTADPKSKTYGDADPVLTHQITNGSLLSTTASTDVISGSLSRVVGENTGAYTIEQGTLDNANYHISYVSDDLTIGARAITVTADATSKTYGDPDPSLTYQVTSGALQGSDVLSGALTRDAGEGVGAYSINQGSLDAGSNYTITYQSEDLTINARPLFVRAQSEVKTYGDIDPAFTPIIASGTLVGSDMFTGDLTRDLGENAGTYTIRQGTLTAGSNYDITFISNGSLSITERILTITADPQSKTYGELDPTFTYQIASGALQGSDVLSGALGRANGEDVGNYAINLGTLDGGINYFLNFVSNDLTIGTRAITVTADAQTKTYGNSDPLLSYQLSDGALQFSDAFTGVLTRDAGEDIGTYAINQGTLDAGSNYDLTYVPDDLTISQRPIGLLVSSPDKIYGNSDPELTYSLFPGSILVAGDEFTGTLARNPGEDAGSYAIGLGTLSAGPNYTLSIVLPATLTIDPIALSITADNKTKVQGTADPALTYTLTSVALINGDQLTGNLQRVVGETLGDYAIQQGTLTAGGNYNINFTDGTLTITDRLLQMITFNALTDVTYGDAMFTLGATGGASGNAVTYIGDNPAVATVTSTGEVTIVGVGMVNITANQAGSATFAAADPVIQTLTVNKKDLVVTADDQSKTYGAANPALTVSYSGFVNADDAGFLNTVPVASTTATAASVVGDYAITAAGGVDDNYSFTYSDGTLTVNKATLTARLDDASFVYGTTTVQNHPVTYSGFVNGDDASVLSISPDGIIADVNEGGTLYINGHYLVDAVPYVGAIKWFDTNNTITAANYEINYTNGDLTVTQASLTITGDNRTVTYGEDANTGNTVNFGTFVSGEDETFLTGTLAFNNISDVNVGTYSGVIVPTGLTSDNYVITYIAGDLTINQATLTVIADDQSKIYGASNPSLTVSYSGFQNGDDESTLTTVPTASTTADETIPTGSYAITSSGGLADNYSFTYTDGTLTVNQATLSVTADDQSKTYGAANPALTVSYSGFQNGDDATSLTTEPTAATTADETSSTGNYAITASGGVADNYTFTYTDGSLTINQATLNVTADDQSKTYGAANPALTVSYSGFQNGDDETSLSTAPTAATTADATSAVGTYAITASGGVADNYTFTYTDGTLTVNQATLSVTADDQGKTYGAANPALTVTYSGFQNGDDETSLTTEPTASTTADETSPTGTYAITASGGLADNYTFNYTDGTLTVNQATLSVTAEDQSKTYGAANPALTVSYSGFQNGDDETSLTTEPTAATTADETSSTGNYAITALGGVADNYTFTYTDGSLTINQATLNVTADDQSKTYGAGNPALTVTYSGFQNGDDETSLSTAPTAATTADATSAVGTYAITASGGVADNYTFTYTDGTLTVNQATLSVTADDQGKTYGAANPALTVTYSGFQNGDDETSLTTEPTASTTADETSPIGTYAITASGGLADNYTFNYTDGTLTVNQATLSVTAEDQSKTYGAANPALTVTYSGFLNGDDETSLSTAPTAATTADATSAVGTYAITASGGVADNYAFSYTDGTLTINQATLSVTADDQGKTYGAANPALTVTYSGFRNGDDETSLSTAPTAATTADATSAVGTYAITASGGVADNYTFTYTDGTLTVNQATLSVTADDQGKTYGAANPALTVTYSGFQNGDDETSLTTEPTASTTADETSPTGTYAITASGGLADNYTFNYTDGTLTVNQATLSVTAEDQSKTYGAANPALTVTYSGFQNGDDETSLTTEPTASTTADETSPIGTYVITASGGSADNYTFNYTDGTLMVDQATLSVTADDQGKTYGAANPALTVTYSGFQNGDDETSLTTEPTASTTADETSPTGTYAITASGGLADNYTFNYTDGTLTVNQATLSVTAEDQSKTYGAANPALTVTYSGFQNGDDETSLSTAPTAATTAEATSAVGTYAITASGGVADNYAFSYTDGTLTINQATLSVTADDQSKTYGATNPSLTVNYSGFQNGDDATNLTAEPTASTTADETSPTGTYAITASGGAADNYTFTYVDGMLTVDQAALSIQPIDQTISYGDAIPSFTVKYAGFVNNEDAKILTTSPTISTTATSTSGVGTYPITVSGATATNYVISYTDGTLTIDQATLTVTADDQSRMYGAVNPTLTFTYSGFLNGDDATVITTVPTATTTADTTSPVDTYAITTSGGASDNYLFSYVNGTLTINKATLTVTAEDKSKTYGAENPTLTIAYDGFVNDEDASALDVLPTASTLVKVTSEVGTYAINLSGRADDNYELNYVSGTLTVNPAELVISADDQSRAFGEANPTLTVTYTGFVNDENQLVLSTIPVINTTADESSTPGDYAIDVSGAEATNYSITHVAGTLTVMKADQQIAFDFLPVKTTTDEAFDLTATASSGLNISYTSTDETVATVNGATVTIIGAGTTLITASQTGDDNYNAATDVTQQLVVTQANDTRITSSIEIDPIADQTVGNAPITLTAITRPVDAPITWEIISGPATITESVLTLGDQAGLVQVKGSIKETDEYKGSEDVVEFALLDASLVTPIIDFILPTEVLNTATITLTSTVDVQGATTVSEADVIYTVVSGPGTITNTNELSFTDIGRVIVSASLAATAETNAISAQSSVEVIALYSITGTIRDENGDPFTDGIIIVGDLNDLTNSQTTAISADGTYTFSQLRSGDYELFVTPFSIDYVMTFYGDISPVIDEDAIPLGLNITTDLTNVDVTMQLAPQSNIDFLPAEEGGMISFFAQNNQGNGNRFVQGRVENGDPLPNTLVILKTAADEYVAADVTNDLGLIEFTGLPTGDYKLLVDIPGVGTMSASVGVIEGQQVDVTALIDESGAAFNVDEVLSTIPAEMKQIRVYPNPVQDYFEIRSLKRVEQVQVYDLNGRSVQQFGQRDQYDIRELPEGLYMVRIITSEGATIQRLMKQ
ncbi:MAG: MBG domain-containing protein [Cytophagales bacterium]|nr:MBG domain-containing protein [Cytophagales bacterium]